MTNFEYIKRHMTDVDFAYFMTDLPFTKLKPCFVEKVYAAWSKWAKSVSNNHGNMAKGNHGNTTIKENPSVWYWERWCMPDGSWKRMGRTQSVSIQVWLSKQYDATDWQEFE